MSATDSVTIGVVIDGPWYRNAEFSNQFQQEITELLKSDYQVQFPDDRLLVSDWTVAGVTAAIDSLMSDESVDVLLAAGVIASHLVCSRDSLPKPVVAPYVIDVEVQQLPFNGVASGVANLCYIVPDQTHHQGFDVFHEIAGFDRVLFLYDRRIGEAFPELPQHVAAVTKDLGIEFDALPVGGSAADVLNRLPADVQAVYVGILMELPPDEFTPLFDGLNQRKVPTFSILGKQDVQRGALAGLGAGVDFQRIARRAALDIQRILLGERAGEIPVILQQDQRLIINMATARQIGLIPDWSVLTEAELFNEVRTEVTRRLNLTGVVDQAVRVNRDLAAARELVRAGRQEVNKAWSHLLPQVELSALGVIIDKDRAEASFGQQAERSLSGTAGVTQLLFSEPAWAGVSIQQNLQRSREEELQQTQLDIALEAAVLYLDLLRAKTFERIQKDNLSLTRSNLERARLRQAIGMSGRSEVYRWESQLASNRQEVVKAQALRNVAEIALNRLLHRPGEEPFLTEEASIENSLPAVSRERLLPYLNNKWSFRVFRQFMVREGLSAAPELKQLDAAIAARQRRLSSRTYALFTPSVALTGEVTNVFERDGAGSTSPAIPPQFSFPAIDIDDLSWSVGARVTFAPFSGGSKWADRAQARAELKRLELLRVAAADRVEQRIRSALHLTGSSYASIGFSRDAAEAAGRNLELVTDAYSRGVVSILDLLDAQTSAVVADQVAANAVYDFLIDLLSAQHAAGGLEFLTSDQERLAWFDRLDRYFEEKSAGEGVLEE